MNRKLYSVSDCDLIYEWTEKWLALIDLINNVTGTNEAPWSPPPPIELEEIKYQQMRFWFIDHQEKFVPLWKEFKENSDCFYPQDDIDEDGELPQKYIENYFLYFYEPENLYRLTQQLELQSGNEIWEPSEDIARIIRPIIIRLGQLMIEFVDWIDEQMTNYD